MSGRRERMEFTLKGGKPWGFSVKGGSDHGNKPLVISKMEKFGKAESSGLAVGDRLFSVNNVPLSGIRLEAIKIIKTSGPNLTLEIERGASQISQDHRSEFNPDFKERVNEPYKNYSSVQYNDDNQRYIENRLSPQEVAYQLYPNQSNCMPIEERYLDSNHPRSRDRSLENIPDLQYDEDPVHYKSNKSLNEPESNPHRYDVGEYHDRQDVGSLSSLQDSVTSDNRFRRRLLSTGFSDDGRIRGNSPPLHAVSSEAVNSTGHNQSLAPSYLRLKKARDKNYTKDRPKSWHASKHFETPDQDSTNTSSSSIPSNLYNNPTRNMRSPSNSDYDSSHYYARNEDSRSRRKSKGWQESDYLKSAVKGDLNESRDSLMFGDSNNRISRNSVSSSRSSGTMSSSRGSLDNLDSYHHRKNSENIIEDVRQQRYQTEFDRAIRENTSNVGQKKNIYEKLVHGNVPSTTKLSNSKENIYKTKRSTGRLSPASDSRSGRSSRTSFSPPSSLHDQSHVRQASKSSRDSDESISRGGFSPPQYSADTQTTYIQTPSINNYVEPNTECYPSLVKQTYDSSKGIVNEVTYPQGTHEIVGSPPKPPQRSAASSRAVQTIQETSKERTQFSDQSNVKTSQYPYFPNGDNHQRAIVKPVKPVTPSLATHITEDHKANESKPHESNHQPLMFGVMAVNAEGGKKSLITKSIAISSPTSSPSMPRSSDKKNIPEAEPPRTKSPQRYELLKDAYSNTVSSCSASNSATDYASRILAKKAQSFAQLSTQNEPSFIRNIGDKSRSSGRYGEIWKTPQFHRRSKSSEIDALLETGSSPDDNTRKLSATSNDVNKDISQKLNFLSEQTKGSPIALEEDLDAKSRRAIYRGALLENQVKTDGESSILKFLQNNRSQESYRKSESGGEKNREYFPLWEADSKLKIQQPKISVQSPTINDNKFKTVELDEKDDDAFYTRQSINKMSKKVLRATSFTRKDLELSPVNISIEQRRKKFEYPIEYKPSQPAYRHIKGIHGRSKSFGNELEEGSEPISSARSSLSGSSTVRSTTENEEHSASRVRPKSAGASNRHAPKQRQTVLPQRIDQSAYNLKAGSLPRNYFASGIVSHLSSPEHQETEVKVRPESAHNQKTPVIGRRSSGTNDISKSEALKEFFIRKTGRPASRDERRKSQHSSEGFSSGDEVEKRNFSVLDTSNQSIAQESLKSSGDNEIKTTSKPTRAKSTSSLIDDLNDTKSQQSILTTLVKKAPQEKLVGTMRSSSLENLTADSITSPSESAMSRLFGQSHSKVSSPIRLFPSKDEQAANIPTSRHRHRDSHSSSASSATTVSTLSSFSSSSATSTNTKSLKHPPTVQESDNEIQLNDKEKNQNTTLKEDTNSIDEKLKSPPQRPKFDSSTYRVAKGRKSRDGVKVPEILPTENIAPKFTTELKLSLETKLSKSEDQQQPSNNHLSEHSVNLSSRLPGKHERSSIVSNTPSSISSSSGSSISSPARKKSNTLVSESTPPRAIVLMGDGPLVPPPAHNNMSEDILKRLKARPSFPHFSTDELPPPPPPPPKSPIQQNDENYTRDLPLPPKPDANGHFIPPLEDSYKEQTYLRDTDLDGSGNIKIRDDKVQSFMQKPQTYENVIEIQIKHDVKQETTNESTDEEERENSRLLAKISEELAPEDLTRDVIENDKSLAPWLSINNKKMRDYMEGIMPEPSKELEKKSRRRKRKADNAESSEDVSNKQCQPVPSGPLLVLKRRPSQDQRIEAKSPNSNLPASSTYYQTSASKAKILNLVQEKVADGEIDDTLEENNQDETNSKKVQLILSIRGKVAELQKVRDLLKDEINENEDLGKQLMLVVKQTCTIREQEKYSLLVQDINHIINLLLSLSSRLARVENALAMLSPDASTDEKNSLQTKKSKLSEQHEEAKNLKDNIDKRQKIVSDILAHHLNEEQFADYEHYVKTKTALIMDQRELDDKMKLGDEQIQILGDSLPYEWQKKLEDIVNKQENSRS